MHNTRDHIPNLHNRHVPHPPWGIPCLSILFSSYSSDRSTVSHSPHLPRPSLCTLNLDGLIHSHGFSFTPLIPERRPNLHLLHSPSLEPQIWPSSGQSTSAAAHVSNFELVFSPAHSFFLCCSFQPETWEYLKFIFSHSLSPHT